MKKKTKLSTKEMLSSMSPMGGFSSLRLFVHFFGSMPHQLDIIETDGIALRKILLGKPKKGLLLEKNFASHDLKNKEKPELYIHTYIYSTREIMSFATDGITYLYDKESQFSKDEIVKLAKANPVKDLNSKIGFDTKQKLEMNLGQELTDLSNKEE